MNARPSEIVSASSGQTAGARGWRRPVLALLLLFTVVLAYQPAWRAGFIWDDDVYVTENPLLTAADGLKRIWFSTDSPSQYFPMVYTVFRAERAAWGLNAAGYHGCNILLHAANALLVWHLLRRLAVPGAWLGAAIFALHPVQVESVAWITELKNVLSLFFSLLALLAWTRWIRESEIEHDERQRPAHSVSRSFPAPRIWYALALACHALALFAKTTACTLPAGLLLILWLTRQPIDRRRVGQVVPFVAMGAAMGIVSIWWERHHQGTVGDAFALSGLERLAVAGRAVWFYLGKLVWPANLTFNYPRWTIRTDDLSAYVGVLALGVVGIPMAVLRRRIGRGVETAFAFYVATLLPLLGVFALYTFKYTFVADHYQYVALIGPAALVGSCVARGGERAAARATRLAIRAAAGALVLLLAVSTWRQARTYRDLETLWTSTLERNPRSFMAHNNVGALYLARGEIDRAIGHFERALESSPGHSNALGNLGHAWSEKGQASQALEYFRRAVAADPTSAKAHSDLAAALAEMGDFVGAVAQAQRAVAIEPRAVEARNILAFALLRSGRAEDALVEANRVLAIESRFAPAQHNAGVALMQLGRSEEAIASYRRALALQPSSAAVYLDLGIACAQLNRVEDAVTAFRQHLALAPRSAHGIANLAVVLAQAGDHIAAAAEFERALSLDSRNAALRLMAARNLLALGRTDAALAAYDALLAQQPADGALAEAVRSDIAAYRTYPPAHEPASADARVARESP